MDCNPNARRAPPSVDQLSILLTNNREIHTLNRTYRGKDRPTDVLSFSQIEGDSAPSASLGDLVISLETTKTQAQEYGVTFAEELLRLIIHGTLHLHGYDHENVSRSEVRAMQGMEDTLHTLLRAEALRQFRLTR